MKKSSVVWAIVLSLGLLISGAPAVASVLPSWAFMDGFEGVPGVAPGGVGDYDPANPRWNNIGEGVAEDIQVHNVLGGGYEGDQYMHIKKGPLAEAYWNWTPLAYSSILNEPFVVKHAFRVGNSVHGYRFWLGRRNGEPPAGVNQGLGVMVQGSELGVYYPSGQPYNFSSLTEFGFDTVPISSGVWYHVQMSVDPGQWNGSSWDVEPGFDLYLDGVLVGSDLPWNSPDYARQYGLNSLHTNCHSGSLGSWADIDSVMLVPEPATLVLLGLGLGLLRRRR